MDLHPYDGATRRFRHDDADQTVGLEVIRRIRAIPAKLFYDLSFYSGGIGIIDSLHISALTDPAPLVADWLRWPDANDEILWLIGADEETPADTALRQFVAHHRAPEFQPAPTTLDVWFEPQSGVNSWALVYVEGGFLHYLAYDQG